MAVLGRLVLGLVLATWWSNAGASPEPEPAVESPGSVPWIGIERPPTAGMQALYPDVVRDLAAGLARSHIALHTGPSPPEEPDARIIRFALEGATGRVQIEVVEVATGDAVHRAIDLDGMVPAARSLALAVAIEELVRASLADPGVSPAAAPSSGGGAEASEPPPDRPEAANEAAVEPRRPRSHDVSAGLAFDAYGGGVRHLGADLSYRIWWHPRVGTAVAFSGRGALPVRVERGRITGRALGGQVSVLTAPLDHRRRFTSDVLATVQAMAVHLRGEPVDEARGRSVTLPAVTLAVRAQPAVALGGPVGLVGDVGLGAVVVRADAREQGRTVHGVSGLWWSARIFIRVRFPSS